MPILLMIASLCLACAAAASDFWFPNHHGPGSSEIHFGCGDAECTTLSMRCEKSGTIEIGYALDGESYTDDQTLPMKITAGAATFSTTGTVTFSGGSLQTSAPASEPVFLAMRNASDITVEFSGGKIKAPLSSLGKKRAVFLNACGVPKRS